MHGHFESLFRSSKLLDILYSYVDSLLICPSLLLIYASSFLWNLKSFFSLLNFSSTPISSTSYKNIIENESTYYHSLVSCSKQQIYHYSQTGILLRASFKRQWDQLKKWTMKPHVPLSAKAKRHVAALTTLYQLIIILNSRLTLY